MPLFQKAGKEQINIRQQEEGQQRKRTGPHMTSPMEELSSLIASTSITNTTKDIAIRLHGISVMVPDIQQRFQISMLRTNNFAYVVKMTNIV